MPKIGESLQNCAAKALPRITGEVSSQRREGADFMPDKRRIGKEDIS